MKRSNPYFTRLPASIDANMSAHENTPENRKSAHKVHTKSKRSRPAKSLPKTVVAYWLGKVRKPKDRSHYNVQIMHQGERHRFPLMTADKTIAAERGRDRYLHLVANGWQATLERYQPEAVKPKKPATIGEWTESVKTTADFRPSTFTNYLQSLRQIAAEISDIGDQPALDENGRPKKDRQRRIIYHSRFDYRAGGRDAWIAKVDALPLSVLSAAALRRWRIEYVGRAGTAPDARRRAENSSA